MMLNSQPGNASIDPWREKYIAQGEAFDQQIQSLEDYTQLLQRALVRISLAADGQDSELDKSLENLRRLLRKAKPSIADISGNLATIENTLLRLDNDTSTASDAGLNALNQLISQLLEMDLSRDNKKALKAIAKALKKQGDNLKAYPQLLNEYARVQQRAINESLQQLQAKAGVTGDKEGGKQNQGILSKLFSSNQGGSERGKTETTIADTAVETAPVADNQIENNISPPTAATVEPGIKEQASIQKVDEPENEKDEKHPVHHASKSMVDFQYLCESLAGLVERLSIPETEKPAVEALRNRIDAELNSDEVVGVIEELAQLIIMAVDKGQQDFEQFLQTLDKQLLEINAFLSESYSAENERRNAAGQFDQDMRSQVNSFSDEVMQATDLNLLKNSVKKHLDLISVSMDQWVDAEKQHESQANEQVAALKEQLSLLENETSAIKARLRKERINALTDILTGVPNREAMDERLSFEWKRFQRYGHPLVLAVLDIDYFKQVNDEYGHLVGDKVLKDVSKTVQKLTRKTDFFARYGGEEFVIIMPETKLDGAVLAMNKIREEIENLTFSYLKKDKNITVSFGLVAFRKGVSLETLFDLADKALYQAKIHGRNRVEVAK